MEHHEELTGIIVDEAFQLHKDLGPGLLESVYSALLTLRLVKRGLKVEREKSVVFTYEGVRFEDGLRIDLLVEGCVVVELLIRPSCVALGCLRKSLIDRWI